MPGTGRAALSFLVSRSGGERAVVGAQMAAAAYLLLSCQDATLKYLLTSFSIWQLLSIRSAVILAACLAVGRGRVVQMSYRSPVRWALTARALTALLAWWCFFAAAKTLPIGQLTTLYLVAPILATGLSAYFLRERVVPMTYLALGLGAVGTLAAVDTFDRAATGASALVVAGAVVWAATIVLMRWVGQRESSLVQLTSNNLLFFGVSTAMALGGWQTPTPGQFFLMVAVGVLSGAGQWLLIASAKRAPVCLTAPLQYSGLIWAFILGFVVWDTVPSPHVMLGAVLIGLAGALVLARKPGGEGLGPLSATRRAVIAR